MQKNSRKNKKWLGWLAIFLAILILAFFGIISLKEIRKKRAIEKEIETLKKEAVKIEKENKNLQEKISYLNSEEYQKIQAKDKLGLQEPDENVVVIASGPVKKEQAAPEEETKNVSSEEKIPNFKKWLNFFLK